MPSKDNTNDTDDILALIQRRKAELGLFLVEALEDEEITPEEVAEAEEDLAELKSREALYRQRLEIKQTITKIHQRIKDTQQFRERALYRQMLLVTREVFATQPPDSEHYLAMKALAADSDIEEDIATLDDPEVWPPSLLEKIAAWQSRDHTGEAEAIEQALVELRKGERILSGEEEEPDAS